MLAGRRQSHPRRGLRRRWAGARLRANGHTVVGVDVVEHPGVRERLDGFVQGDLDPGVPAEVGGDFDLVLAAHVIEHVLEP